jgi:serine/threonine-protein kinase
LTTDGGDPDSKDGADTFLRAIAAAPELPVESAPARIAHFRILGKLGQGGMGVVYRAEDEQLRRTIALKLLPDPSGDEEKKQRFLREARSAAAITHPNVAVVHQIGEVEGRIYIAMELVEGENLRARLDRGRLDVATARELAVQIARGLSAAHDKGIVHRDLKPENVMITPAGLVKILDFGLAKPEVARRASGPTEAALAKTETLVTSDEGRVMGTPEYMSPEQALGEAVDVRSDVFSFGIVLYEMLAGVRPFMGASTGAVLVAIARDAAPPLRERVPEATEAVVRRCLAKPSKERFANAGEIVTALDARASAGAVPPSRTDVEPITRSATVPKRPKVAVVAAAFFVVAVAGGIGAWRLAPPARTSAAPVSASALTSSNAGPRHRGIAVTDYPAAAYAAALRDIRSASMTLAENDLATATRLDPTLAAAQLQASLVTLNYSETVRRQHLAAAEALRNTLNERDRMLLGVAEASLAEPRVQEEVLTRLRTLVQRFPDDAQSSWLLAYELLHVRQVNEARTALLRALDLDPEYAGALKMLGNTYWWGLASDDPDQALDFFGRCVEISPSSGSCLRQRDDIYGDQGQCAKVEADARTMTVVEPQGSRAFEYLALALAAENAPPEAVEEALRRRASLAPDPDTRTMMVEEDSFATALLAGDFVSAETSARREIALVEGAQTELEHYVPTAMLLDVLEERGDWRRALAEAEGFERKAAAWTRDAPWGVPLRLAFLRYEARRMDDVALDGALEELRRRYDGAYSWEPRNRIVPEGYLLLTSAQATRALARLGDVGASHWEPQMSWAAASLGRIYLLAGHPAEAIGPLRLAAQACTILTTPDSGNTIWWMRAHVLLGQALEQTGDHAGACAAYAVVLDRWKNAKPRSVTLEKAKDRSRVLGCSKP